MTKSIYGNKIPARPKPPQSKTRMPRKARKINPRRKVFTMPKSR